MNSIRVLLYKGFARYLRNRTALALTFIVPIGCVAYFPVVGLLGHADRLGGPRWISDASPVLGFVFLSISLSVWRFGVRRYTSTGS